MQPKTTVDPVVFVERDVAICSKCQARMFRLGEDLWECFRCGEIERHNENAFRMDRVKSRI